MPMERHVPSESELHAFAAKLGQFRSTLPQNEQRILDGILLAACGEQAEVRGYGFADSAVKEAALMVMAELGIDVKA